MNNPDHDPSLWVEKYGDYLMRYAQLRLKNYASAEDAVQETFLAGVKGLDRFDGRVEVKYWLRGILRNKIVDYIRKAVREQPVEDPESYELPQSTRMKVFGIPTSNPVPWEFDVHQAFDEKEFWRIFRECTDALQGNIQRAFVLKELEGLATPEVCKVLDISPNNLWVMIHRARNQLKKCLEQKWNR